MAVIQPTFSNVTKITKENFTTVRDGILKQQFLDAAVAEDIIRNFQDDRLQRVDQPDKPVLIENNRTRIYLWNDPADPENPRKMVAVYGELTKKGEDIHVTPELMIKGPDVNFMMFYQMTCCAALSVLACFAVKGQHRAEVRDSLSGTHKGQGQMFAGKVKIATSEELLNSIHHMYLDITAKPHDCDSHQSYKPDDLKP